MTSLSDIRLFIDAHYDVNVISVTPLTEKVWKLACSDKIYLLKMTSGEESFLMKQLYAHKELKEHVLPIYKTRSGESIARTEAGFAYLTDYVEQIPMPFEKQVHDYSKMLRKLHENTLLNVEKHEEEIRVMYESDFGRLKVNFMLLDNYMQNLEVKVSRSPFEWYVLMIYPLLYGMYRRADDIMEKFYKRLSKKKSLPISLVHGDVNVSNVLAGTASTYIINFEKSSFDLPSVDLIMFLKHYHQMPGASHVIMDLLKNQENTLIHFHFFLRTLCIDLEGLFKTLSGNSLIDISLLNETLAPGILAMEVYDELYPPKKPKSEKEKASKKE